MYFIIDYRHVRGYITSLFLAYFIAFAYSFALLLPVFKKLSIHKNKLDKPLSEILKEMLVYGLWSSVDNLAEGLATRLNYFLIQHSGGYGKVGLLDSGTKISESAWHISNSISSLEYKEVSKTPEVEVQKRVTLRLFGLTFCALTAVMLVVVFIPERVYTDYLLSAEFVGIRKIITGLSVGVIAFGCNRILSHYFIGSGKVKYSAYCSITGLAVLFIAGSVLIPGYGVFGAAITASIAYSCMLVFSITVFMKQTGSGIKDFFQSFSIRLK
jgi:O-antigen/teichoic acid export membrane protein